MDGLRPGFLSREKRSRLGQPEGLLAVGGVSEKNAGEFMKAGCVGVGVGGNLVNGEWIVQGQWDRITALAKELCASVNG